jgi:hypothetical protein
MTAEEKVKHLDNGYFDWEPEEGEAPKPEPMNLIFAKVMEILTYAGMIIMVIFGAAYIFGVKPFIHPAVVEKYWHLEADKFWTAIKGYPIRGYYFFKHLTNTDCLSLIGISILAIAPLISMVFSFFKAEKIYKIFFFIVICIFIFAVLKPILLPHLGGGH